MILVFQYLWARKNNTTRGATTILHSTAYIEKLYVGSTYQQSTSILVSSVARYVVMYSVDVPAINFNIVVENTAVKRSVLRYPSKGIVPTRNEQNKIS
jgi:hypothetical protein